MVWGEISPNISKQALFFFFLFFYLFLTLGALLFQGKFNLDFCLFWSVCASFNFFM